MTVVFPAPFGPRKPKHSPAEISKAILSTALRELKSFVRFIAETVIIENGELFFQFDRIYRTVLFRGLTAAGIIAGIGVYYL